MHEEEHIARAHDHDPIRRSWRESHSFNLAWFKHGERLTWTQRIGFAVISLFFLLAGLISLFSIVADMLEDSTRWLGILWDLCLALIFTLVFLLPGILGIRNVVRFPNHEGAGD